jgi:hypothetical protein
MVRGGFVALDSEVGGHHGRRGFGGGNAGLTSGTRAMPGGSPDGPEWGLHHPGVLKPDGSTTLAFAEGVLRAARRATGAFLTSFASSISPIGAR